MIKEKRTAERVDRFLIVECSSTRKSQEVSPGITRNVSVEGFSMEAHNFDPRPGEILEFTLKNSQRDLFVTVKGEIIWKRNAWYKHIAGIKLQDTDIGIKSTMKKLITLKGDAVGRPDFSPGEREILPDQESREASFQPGGEVYSGTDQIGGYERETAPGDDITSYSRSENERTMPARDELSLGHDHSLRGNRRRTGRAWVYIPAVTTAIVILLIAVPVIINNYTGPETIMKADRSESGTPPYIDREEGVLVREVISGEDRITDDANPSPGYVQMGEQGSLFEEQTGGTAADPASSGNDLSDNASALSPEGNQLPKKREAMVNVPFDSGRSGRDDRPVTDAEAGPTDLLAKIDQFRKNRVAAEAKKPVLPEIVPVVNREDETLPGKESGTFTGKASTGAAADKVADSPLEPEAELPLNEEPVIETTALTEGPLKNEVPLEPEQVTSFEPPYPGEKVADFPGLLVKARKAPIALTIAKNEEGLKNAAPAQAERSNENEPADAVKKLPKIALGISRSRATTENEISVKKRSASSLSGMSGEWTPVGTSGKGIPLFIDPNTISYPSEQVVKLFVKASVDSNEFADLIEINCARNKLRILKEGTHDSPALTAYSQEWKDIMPENMVLHNSVCSNRSLDQ